MNFRYFNLFVKLFLIALLLQCSAEERLIQEYGIHTEVTSISYLVPSQGIYDQRLGVTINLKLKNNTRDTLKVDIANKGGFIVFDLDTVYKIMKIDKPKYYIYSKNSNSSKQTKGLYFVDDSMLLPLETMEISFSNNDDYLIDLYKMDFIKNKDIPKSYSIYISSLFNNDFYVHFKLNPNITISSYSSGIKVKPIEK